MGELGAIEPPDQAVVSGKVIVTGAMAAIDRPDGALFVGDGVVLSADEAQGRCIVFGIPLRVLT